MRKFDCLKVGNLNIDPPIIQGGMGVRVSSSSLASAVSNEGALGVIAAVALGEDMQDCNLNFTDRSSQSLRNIIRKTKKLTKNPFGVNIMCALTNYADLVNVSQEESVDVIISGAGLPLKLPSLIKNRTTKLIPIVSSGRAAKIICSVWVKRYSRLPDAIIVEGPLAGGHLGYSIAELGDASNFNLDKILVDVLKVAKSFENKFKAKIPVIAAGGIFDRNDIERVLKLGASGVQIATRFVCTHECDASVKYKKAYLNSKKSDIVIIKSPVGMPGRVMSNKFVERINKGERIDFDCQYKCLVTCDPKKVNYCIAKALINAYHGELDKGFVMCGSNAYRIKKIISVKDLINELTHPQDIKNTPPLLNKIPLAV